MRNIKTKLFLNAILYCLLLVLAQSCINDVLPDNTTKDFEITLNIQNDLEVVTRASSISELRIERGFVLVYDRNKNFKSIYPIDKNRIENNGSSNPKITIEGFILNNDIVVFILNPRNDISVNPPTSVNYSAIDAIFELGDTGFETGVNGLPMYGEYVYGSSNSVTITRAVAKIEIYINSSVSGDFSEGFTPENIKYDVFQQVKKGHIIKQANDLNYVPTDNGVPITEISPDYDFNKPIGLNRGSYIYEYPYSNRAIGGGSLSDTNYDKDRLAVILKVNRNGSFEYYRLDLYNQTTKTYLNVERNKHYKIIIKSINRKGYDTATQALGRQSSNTDINYEIVIGDDKTISNGKISIDLKNYHDAILIRDPSYSEIEIAQVKYSSSNDILEVPTENKITYSTLPIGVTANLSIITKEFQSITFMFSDEASFETTNISYTITLGDLVHTRSLDISRKPVILDCHPYQFNVGDSSIVFSNTTPSTWVDSGNTPIFEDKKINEYQTTSSGKKIRYIVGIKAPRYIGGDITSPKKHMIMESIEEKKNLSWNAAINYCKLKNDLNGNGILDNGEEPLWRLPKETQLNGVFTAYNAISELLDGYLWLDAANFFGTKMFASCSDPNVEIRLAFLSPNTPANLIRTRCIRDL